MVAIVSGNALGLSLGSLGTLGARGGFGNASEGRNGESAYVNAATGNLVLQAQDDLLVSRGVDAAVLRVYNSQGLFNDDNGDNWSSGFYAQQLRLTGTRNAAGSTLTRTDRDGAVAVYAFDTASGKYLSMEGAGAYDRIGFDAATSRYVWTDGDSGIAERYDAATGRLASVTDASGNTLSYTYNTAGKIASSVNASGETTHYDYNGNNLAQVRTVLQDGTTVTRVRYGYDSSNRLSTVTVDLSPADNAVADAKTYVTTYTYDGTSKLVAKVSQSDGTSVAFTYMAVGSGYRVASVKDALGLTTKFTYDTTARRTTVTDPLNLVTTIEYDASGRLTKVTSPPVAGVSRSVGYSYDETTGDLLQATDGEGRATTYGYTNGNLTLQRDAAGNTVTRRYDARNQLLTETAYLAPDPDGAGNGAATLPVIKRYVYDAGGKNQLRFEISAEGRVTEHVYNAYGERTSTIEYTGAAYAVAALAADASPTEAQVAAWVAAQDRSRAMRTDMAYDARGQLQKTTRYAGLASNGAGVANAETSVTQYVYDSFGLLLGTVSPEGGATAMTYDGLGRLLTSKDSSGQITVTQYDDAARRVSVTLANGLVTASVQDAGGRLVSVLRTNAAAASLGETRYLYDDGGRLRMTQDASGVRRWMLYDEAGRKVADIDGNDSLTEYVYDRNDQVTQTIAYAAPAKTVSSLLDQAGRPADAALSALRPTTGNAADRKAWRSYDAANRLVKTVDALGAVTETFYDGASRVVKRVQYAKPIATAGLGAAPTPASINPTASAADDRVERFFYDKDGLLLGSLDAEGYLSACQYDSAGRLVATRRYSTVSPAAHWAAGTFDQLKPANAATDLRGLNFYNAKGQLIAAVDAEFHLTEKTYDRNGNLAKTVRYATKVAETVDTGTALSSLRSIHPADQATSYAYDALNRVTQVTHPEGTVTKYAYDNAGNLVSTVLAAGQDDVRTVNARFDLQGRLTGELSAEGAALLTAGQTQAEIDRVWLQYGKTHTYDAAGRRTSTTDANGLKTRYYYDADGALTHTINALGEVLESSYNHFGQLSAQLRYGKRLTAATLATLNGGLSNTTLATALGNLRDTAVDSRTTFTYDNAGRVGTATDALGNADTTGYNAFGDATSTTTALGGGSTLVQSATYDRRGLRTGTLSDGGGIDAATVASYDAFGRLISSTDANNGVVKTSYDRLGRVVQVIDRNAAKRSTTYDAFSRVLTQTDAFGKATLYSYDTAARSTTVTTPEGVSVTTVRNRHGQVVTVTDGNKHSTSYQYDRNGNLELTTTSLTTEKRGYDRAGRLVETTDARGVKTAYEYDAANRVLTTKADPNGLNLTTTYAYDAKGQRVKVTDARGAVTVVEYDLKGRTLRQTVDQGGLNLQTSYTYDARERVLSVTDPRGVVTEYAYDKLGRRTKEVVDTGSGGLNLTTLYTYDKNGNAVTKTDANGNLTRYAYDAGDRLVFSVDALGNTRKTEYDAEGRVSRTTSYATPISLAGLAVPASAAAILVRVAQTSGKDAILANRYDKDGRLRFTVDGTGAVTEYKYDANGNVTERIGYANTIAMASWTGATDPAPVADAARDQRERTTYDALNRATYVADALGGLVLNAYDGNGNLVRRTQYATAIAAGALPSGVLGGADDRVSVFVYDNANRLTWAADAGGAVTRKEYDKGGNVVKTTAYANLIAAGGDPGSVQGNPVADRSTTMAYDKAGRLVYTADALGYVTTTAYDKRGQATEVKRYFNLPASAGALPAANTDQDRTETFAYDAAGRLESSTDALQATEKFTYDGLGNKLTFTNKKGSVWTYTYDAAGRLASETSPEVALTTLKLDTSGNLVEDTAANAALVTRLKYDGLGNLTSRTEAHGRPEERTTLYAYDACGRQIQVIYPSAAVYTPESAAALAANGQAGLATRSESIRTLETKTFYDGLGNAVANIDVARNASFKAYDAMGRLKYEVDALGCVTAYTVNAFGETTEVLRYGWILTPPALPTSASGALTAAQVSAKMNAADVNHTQDRVLKTSYDKAGRVYEVVEPQSYTFDASTNQYETAGKTTRRTYNAFGELVRLDELKNLKDKTWLRSYAYYDKLGRQTASVDALGYLTTQSYDAVGNLTEVAERATALAADKYGIGSYTAAATGNDDRVTRYTYDKANRRSSQTRVNIEFSAAADGTVTRGDATTTYGHDALGNLTRTTDALGGSTYNYYDALGRVAAVAAPSRSSTVDGASLTPVTVFKRDAHGNALVKTEHAKGAAAAAEFKGVSSSAVTGYPAIVADAASDRTTHTAYDRLGHATQVTDANRVSVFSSYNERGELAKTWQAVTGNNGQTRTLFKAFQYDNLGRLTNTFDPASSEVLQVGSSQATTTTVSSSTAGVNNTAQQYNAFGEVVRKGVNGGWQEYFDYDGAGRLWRTNSGDGVDKVTLYDLLGRATADIRSEGIGTGGAGLGADVRGLASAEQAATSAELRRTDTVYDDLGRVVRQTGPRRSSAQGGVQVRAVTASAAVVASNGVALINANGLPAWNDAANQVNVSWSSLAGLGSGDVRVKVDYVTQTYQLAQASYDETGFMTSPAVIRQGVARSFTQILTAEQGATGAILSWRDGNPNGALDGGVGSVSRVTVEKKDAKGNWVQISTQTALGAVAGTAVEVAAPEDPASSVVLEMRLFTTATWIARPLVDFGGARRFDTSGLAAGTYEYRVTVTPPGQPSRVSASGGVNVSPAGISQSIVANGDSVWQRPVVEQKVDRWGNVLALTDARMSSWKTTYRYNADNRMVQQTQPDGQGQQSASSPTTRVYYDKLGRQVAVRDANGNVNGQVYDAAGNLVEERHADGGVVRHAYDAFGDKRRTVDALGNAAGASAAQKAGHTTLYDYDKAGRLLATTHGPVNVWTLPAEGLLTGGAWTQLTERNTYDQAGRKLTQVNGAGETIRYRYDLAGNLVETTQPLGQRTLSTFDALGRKTAEVDGNGYAATWAYDHFGRLTAHTDIGGASYTYTYDNARQLVKQANSRGQNLAYAYDAAGQLVRATDAALNQETTYAYDLAGRRVRERTVQAGVVYQDNAMGYDALGRLRAVTDARMRIDIEYDAVGNRTRVRTFANVLQPGSQSADSAMASDRHFKYDRMNRQTVVDAVDAAGTLGTTGHAVAYDVNGNRVSDTFHGNRVATTNGQAVITGYDESGAAIYTTTPTTYSVSQGLVTELYRYDNMGRLAGVERDGVQVDHRYYDGAGRMVQSGPNGTLPTGYSAALNANVAVADSIGLQTRRNTYDANGRLVQQRVFKSDNTPESVTNYHQYDGAGNLLGYATTVYNAYTANYTNKLARHEGYREAQTDVSSAQFQPGSTVQSRDFNGHLVGIADSTRASNNRSFVNDLNGNALYVNQGGNAQRQVIVNGEVLGRYGVGINDVAPRNANGDPNFAQVADFDFGYAPITGSHPAASVGAYTVRAGDTLKSIARSAYGDERMWYLIADANNLAGDRDVRAGQTLHIPSTVGGAYNSSTTFKPYDPSRITGDTSPNLAPPVAPGGGGCGAVGMIVMVVVAVVATVFTAGAVSLAMAGTLSSAGFGTIMAAGASAMIGGGMVAGVAVGSMAGVGFGGAVAAAAIGGAVGSIASQGVGIAIGAQQSFNWKQVGMSALGAGLGAAAGGSAVGEAMKAYGAAGAMATAAMSNVATQGIAVAVGLQDQFSWRSVAASAVGAGVSHQVGNALGGGEGWQQTATGFKKFAIDATSRFAGGVASSVVRGGKVEVVNIAADAFGNALGSSLVEAMNAPSQQAPVQVKAQPADLIQNSQQALDVLAAAAEKYGGYHKIPPNAPELKMAAGSAMANNEAIQDLATSGENGQVFAERVKVAGDHPGLMDDFKSAGKQGARNLAIIGGVVTGSLHSAVKSAIDTAALVKDLLLAQQYMLGEATNQALNRWMSGFQARQEAYQNVVALGSAIAEIAKDPIRYLGDAVGRSIDKVTTTLAKAQETDALKDWFSYGKAMGEVTVGVASLVTGAAGMARLATAGARELGTLLRARINELAPDVRGSAFLADQARSTGSPIRVAKGAELGNAGSGGIPQVSAIGETVHTLGPGWRVTAPRGLGSATGPVPDGYVPVSRWVNADEVPLWMENGGTAIPASVGAGGRVYVTAPGAAKPGGTGPIRIDFSLPQDALAGAGKPKWYQIFQPSQSRPVYNVQIHIPEGVTIPKGKP